MDFFGHSFLFLKILHRNILYLDYHIFWNAHVFVPYLSQCSLGPPPLPMAPSFPHCHQKYHYWYFSPTSKRLSNLSSIFHLQAISVSYFHSLPVSLLSCFLLQARERSASSRGMATLPTSFPKSQLTTACNKLQMQTPKLCPWHVKGWFWN